MSSSISIIELCECENTATFLKSWIKVHFQKSSLEQLARKCHIPSKSSLHDILSGRRRPSLDLLNAICSGLKVQGPEKKLLLKIWECEKNKNFFQQTGELTKLRSKVREKDSKIRSKNMPLLEGWDYIYASLGSVEHGATLEDVSRRSRIPDETCVKILNNLIDLQLVTFDPRCKRYLVKGLHSIFEEFSIDEKEYLKSKLKDAQKKLDQGFGEKDKTLFRHYFFSIKKGSYPELRMKLKDLLDEYADESESPTGEELAEVFVAFSLKT